MKSKLILLLTIMFGIVGSTSIHATSQTASKNSMSTLADQRLKGQQQNSIPGGTSLYQAGGSGGSTSLYGGGGASAPAPQQKSGQKNAVNQPGH